MADYKSNYTGEEIDEGIAKANSAVQPEDLGNLATKDTVNYETEVTNKPSEVTEETVANWGFTKNTGTYSKPSGGIPENDLSSEVQAKLNAGGSGISVKEIDYSNSEEWDSEEEQPTAEVIDDILENKYTFIRVYNIPIEEGVVVEMTLVTAGMVDIENAHGARYYYKFDEGDEDEGTSPNIEQYLFIHQEGESAQMIVENFELGTYSKPSGGIPSTDMTEAVQTSLSKADTAIQSLDNYYTKTEVDSKISSVYKYKGSVSTYGDLPSSDLTVGDVYNIITADSTHGIKAGDNVAWTGSAWDVLSGTVDLTGYQTKIDSSHKLSADLVDDTSSTNKFVTASDKTTWNGKSVVSGTNDGTNWTALTINGTTKNIPAGGSSAEEIYPIAITATPYSTNIELAPAQNITLQDMGSEAPGYTAAPYTTLQQVSYTKPYDSVLAEFQAGHQYLLPLISADSSMLMYGIDDNGMPIFDADHPCAILIQLNNGAIDSVMMISNSEYGPDGTLVATSLKGYFYSDTEFSFNAGGIRDTDITTAISAGKIPVAIINWRYKDYQSWCQIKSFDEEDYYFEGEYKGSEFTLICDGSYWRINWSPIYQETLVSGTNIKTINGTSILGSGNIEIDTDIPVYTPTDYDIDLDYDTFSVELSQADINDIIEKKNAVIRFDFDDEIYSFNLTYVGHDDKDDTDYFVYTFNLVNENVVLEISLSSDNGGEISECNLIRTVQANPTLEGGEEDLESITIGGTKYAVPSGSTVSGTNDGTNWTALTIDGTTKNIPAGGSGGESDLFIIDVDINPYTRDTTFASPQTISFAEAPGMSGVYMGQINNMPQTINNLPDVVYITYNNTSYALPLIQENSGNLYYGEIDDGAPIFDNYPFFFAILNDGGIQGMIATNIDQSSMQLWVRGVTYIMYGIAINNSTDASFQDIIDAVDEGKIPIVRYKNPAIPDKTYYATVYGNIGETNVNFRGDYDDKIALDFRYGSGSGGFDIKGYLKELPVVCTTSGSTIDFSVDLYNIRDLYNQQEYYIELDGDRYETTKTTWQDEPMSFGITGTYLDSTAGKLKELSLTYTYPTTKTANLEEFDVSGSGGSATDVQINGTSIVSSGTANIVTETAYNASSNKIATMSDVPVIDNPLAGKKVSLIGDSITTWSSVRPDNSYSARYPRGVIQTIDQTWWYQMIDKGGMTLLRNTAYNGSTCTGRDGGNGHNTASTTDAYAACSNKRINDLSDGTSNPDIVICFIGINDFGSDKNTPTGNYIGLEAVPADSSSGMATFSEGYGLMLKKIMTQYPQARVYCCTLPTVGRGSVSDEYTTRWFGGSFPVYNTTTHVFLADYNNTIRTIAHNMGAGIIEFAECVNWFNATTYLEDGLHPNVAGMQLLGDKALAKLQSDFAREEE